MAASGPAKSWKCICKKRGNNKNVVQSCGIPPLRLRSGQALSQRARRDGDAAIRRHRENASLGSSRYTLVWGPSAALSSALRTTTSLRMTGGVESWNPCLAKARETWGTRRWFRDSHFTAQRLGSWGIPPVVEFEPCAGGSWLLLP